MHLFQQKARFSPARFNCNRIAVTVRRIVPRDQFWFRWPENGRLYLATKPVVARVFDSTRRKSIVHRARRNRVSGVLSFSLPLLFFSLSLSLSLFLSSIYIASSSLTKAQSYTVPTNRTSPILYATGRQLLLAFPAFEPRFTAITFDDFPRIRHGIEAGTIERTQRRASLIDSCFNQRD